MDRSDTTLLVGLSFAAAALFGIIVATQARAHEATNTAGQPLGWTYPWACCSGQDCAPVPAPSVQETPNGYRVTLRKGDHPFVADKPLVYDIPYNDKRIKDSPDGSFHICLRSPSTAPTEHYKPLDLLCFYRGPAGF